MTTTSKNHHDLACVCGDCGVDFTTTVNLARYDKIGIETIEEYIKRIGWKKVLGKYKTRCMLCIYKLGDETTPLSDIYWQN